MDYLKQFAGGVKKGLGYLSQHSGKAMHYLKQIPAVGALMEDAGPAIGAAKKLYHAAKKRDISQLPSVDEAIAGLSSAKTTRRKLRSGAYS